MVNFWSILMFLVLLKPVSRAEFKYVCIVWIGNQIREISTADCGFAMSRKMTFGDDFYAIFFGRELINETECVIRAGSEGGKSARN